jgi:hypothetical protein
MTPETILANAFFGFWYIWGDYFYAFWGLSFFLTLFISLWYLIVRR